MKQKNLYWMAGLVFLIVVISYALNVYLQVSNVILSLMLVAVGLVTFYGTIGMGVNKKDRKLSKYDLRLAIVLSLITVYIVLVGTVVFFKKGGELPPIAQTMITHFTTVIGVVIAFYFGAEAYEAVNKPVEESEEEAGKKEE
ncbi:MAG: hypothetical protein HZB19_14235 [Chloroflexi bacterium]|nr:hypothetical protein [Chloroflexota bacterium]